MATASSSVSDQGARLAAGSDGHPAEGGFYVRPTVLSGADNAMAVTTGPKISVRAQSMALSAPDRTVGRT
jgi:hypothetical protein